VIIDFHVHVWEPRYIPARVRRHWAAHAAYRHEPAKSPAELFPRVTVGVSDPGAARLTTALEANGIDRAVIFAVDYGIDNDDETDGSTPIREVLRDYAAIVRRAPERLDFFGAVDPRRPDALARTVEALDNLGARGLKLYPPSGVDPGDPSCDPIYQALIERDAPVAVHTAVVSGPFDSRLASPLMVSRAQQRFPELRIVLAHAGYPAWWEEAVAVAGAHPRTYLELSLWQHAAQHDWDTVSRRILDAVRRVGADRVLFATDSMFGNQYGKELATVRQWIDQLTSLVEDHRLAAEQLDLILGRNAIDLLHLNS